MLAGCGCRVRVPHISILRCGIVDGRPTADFARPSLTMSDMRTNKTVSDAQWNSLLVRTRAKGASLGVVAEGDVERLSDDYRRIRDYVKLAAPEPEVLRIVGEEANRNGTSGLTSRHIDGIIRATRAAKKKL